MTPWLGAWFWLGLWVWILASDPGTSSIPEGDPALQAPPQIEMTGLNIRRKTPYTDDKFTWMDLNAAGSSNIRDTQDSHLLQDVEVKVVIDHSPDSEIGAATAAESFTDLSGELEVAWFLIRADTGVYSFQSDNIVLEGNAEVFGYSIEGELTDWIAADRIIYDTLRRQVRSDGPAIYHGQIYGRPVRGIFTAGLDLTEANLEAMAPIRTPRNTPILNPDLRPVYDPPYALRFLQERKMEETPGEPEVEGSEGN